MTTKMQEVIALDKVQMPERFGQYRGQLLEEVPAGYLLWLWDDYGLWREKEHCPIFLREVRRYIVDRFSHLETECPDRIIKHRP